MPTGRTGCQHRADFESVRPVPGTGPALHWIRNRTAPSLGFGGVIAGAVFQVILDGLPLLIDDPQGIALIIHQIHS